MTKSNTDMLDPDDGASHELRNYAIGFGVSLLLTVGAFAALLSHLPTVWKVSAICIAALLQVMTHARNFLHLSLSGRQSREDLLLVMFSTILLAIMAGGTYFIMADLDGRMHDMRDTQDMEGMPAGG
ncbi:cytochrome o ubiquinol oxidase subunit IV [Novosphingobium aquimarinum]|uniref:cytochrome o ubiquinol oxidase subunit IV n=1 Tax=Novosphingobium aquimarinum TaxID=2682494 RepID=UPI0018DBEB80|nr:cytochrome C oxidase subunit IV family protein [Novosphingobium aquimarinum]